MIIIGLDFYNLSVTGGVAKTITGQRIDATNIPCVLIDEKGVNTDDSVQPTEPKRSIQAGRDNG